MVEDATVGEVCFLSFFPSSKVSDGGQFHILKLACVLGLGGGINRPIEILADDVLPLRGIEVLEVGRGLLAGIVTVDIGIDHGDRRFCENADGRGDDIVVVVIEFLD